MQIELTEIKDALIVPVDAVKHGSVRIKKEGVEQRVDVITGQYDEKNIEIKSGLEGERRDRHWTRNDRRSFSVPLWDFGQRNAKGDEHRDTKTQREEKLKGLFILNSLCLCVFRRSQS